MRVEFRLGAFSFFIELYPCCEDGKLFSTEEAMERNGVKTLFWFGVLLVGTVCVFLLNVGLGSVNITGSDIVRVFADELFGQSGVKDNAHLIIWQLRLPRAMAGLACGAALAISGLLLQTFFENPIVEPYVLGVSSGSSLFVALVTMGGFTFGVRQITPLFRFTGAFIGAMLVMAVVLLAAARVKNVVTLLIVGLMAGYICSAAASILSAFAEREQIAGYAIWSMGTFSGFTWQHLPVLYGIVTVSLVLACLLAKPLNALQMGDRYAASMGVNVRAVRCAIILVSSVLSAAVTAFAGPVSFIGLAVPHICRILFHTSDSRILLPAAMLGGALMAGLCDFAARTIVSPAELPLGAITAVIGAPVVVFLLTRKEKL